jgi:hypothetical protein
MTLRNVITALSPGDKFIYKDREYLYIKTTPADLCCSTSLAHLLLAIDLETYEIMAFDKSWEVEVLT